MHCVNGWCEEVGDMTINGGRIHTQKEAFLIKSHNAILDMTDVELSSESGVLVHTILNSDPCKTPVDDKAYGVNVRFTDMAVTGDLLHEDTERRMWIEMKSSQLTGTIVNGTLAMDAGSKWTADKDSTVHLLNDINPAQIDAAEGVTIHATGGKAGSYTLASGGKLIVEEI